MVKDEGVDEGAVTQTITDEGGSKWSDLWTKEDYWAIWLGFLLIVVGALIFLPRPPEGMDETITSTLAARNGDIWSYTLHPASEGNYTLRIEARDTQGNVSGYGPYNVSVGVKMIYLPLVLRNN